MAYITISDLHPASPDLCVNQEGHMVEVSNEELEQIHGGFIISLINYIGYKIAYKAGEGLYDLIMDFYNTGTKGP